MDTILNLSGVYGQEGWSAPGALHIDLEGLEGCCCYCDGAAETAIRKSLEALPVRGIHWIDTGDYHYISKLWMEKIDEPFLLALFDNHPDDQAGAFGDDLLSCGGWVLAARNSLPMMKGDFLNCSSIPGSLPVYLSIDIDVLSEQYARTGWSQGSMSMEALLRSISEIAAGHRIIGTDICGGLTTAKGATPEDLRINSAARSALSGYFSNHPDVSG